MLGPLLSNELVDLENGQVYLMDGLLLGSVSSLRVQEKRILPPGRLIRTAFPPFLKN